MYHEKPEKVFYRSCSMVQLPEKDSTQSIYFDYLVFEDLEECEIYIPSYLILLQYNLDINHLFSPHQVGFLGLIEFNQILGISDLRL